MRENALRNLQDLLKLLGYNNTDPTAALADLNERIQTFHAATASFNGQRLRTEIMNPLKGIVINQAQADILRFKTMIQGKSQQINEVFVQLVNQVVSNMETTEIGKLTIEMVAEELYALLNSITLNFDTGAVVLGGGKRVKGEYKDLLKDALKPAILKKLKSGIMSVQFSGHTDPNIKQLIDKDTNFTRRLLILARNYGIPLESIFPEAANTAPTFEMAEDDDGIHIYYDILTPFLNEMEASDNKGTKAEKAARDYFEKLPEPKKSEMIELLISRTLAFFNNNKFFDTSMLSPERANFLQEKFTSAIRDILTNYPAALFIGSNEQGIIGILGEIQGLYYIYSILGESNPSIDPATLVSWIGGDTTAGGGVKTGADLVMKISEHLGFGIQIKNSMDLTGSTSFSDFSLNRGDDSDFFNQLLNFGIPLEVVKAIEDLFTMKSFNIPYHLSGLKAVAGDAKGPRAGEYRDTYSKLDELMIKAQRYMALAAAMIMRIQYLQGEGFMQNNTLWIVGGTAIISAVQILDDLIAQVDGALDRNMFRSYATTNLDKNNYNIVDYINNNDTSTSRLKTVLRTSYNFHKVSTTI